jgi:DNA-binding transcriptional regulator YdaS (Cro superfamily)
MDLKHYLHVPCYGYQKQRVLDLAYRLSVSESAVRAWSAGRRTIDLERLGELIKVTQGKVTAGDTFSPLQLIKYARILGFQASAIRVWITQVHPLPPEQLSDLMTVTESYAVQLIDQHTN